MLRGPRPLDLIHSPSGQHHLKSRAVREIKAVTLFVDKWAGAVAWLCPEAQPRSVQVSGESLGEGRYRLRIASRGLWGTRTQRMSLSLSFLKAHLARYGHWLSHSHPVLSPAQCNLH